MKQRLKHWLHQLGGVALGGHLARLPIPHASSREVQRVLTLAWQERAALGRPLPSFDEAGFRAFSQTNEDGILLLLQALLGRGDATIVEIGCGDGRENNSTNLIVNHGWNGYLFDGSAEGVANARRFFAQHPDTRIHPPRCTHSWFTRGTINEILREAGVPARTDILSLDVDGMDYWLWEALTWTRARIVVLEYNNVIPADRSITVPYADDFQTSTADFTGASLRAMVALSARKGYRFVGCNHLGYNAFFVDAALGEDRFPARPVESGLSGSYPREAREKRFPAVAKLPWVEV